jgi:hypothetical protein
MTMTIEQHQQEILNSTPNEAGEICVSYSFSKRKLTALLRLEEQGKIECVRAYAAKRVRYVKIVKDARS